MRKLASQLYNWVALARVIFVVLSLILVVLTMHPDGVDVRWAMYFNADKILHALVGFFMTVLALMALPRAPAPIVFLVIVAAVGVVELMQMVGPRSADFIDFVMGLVGISAVALNDQISKYRIRRASTS